MLRSTLVEGKIGDRDSGIGGRRELDLCLFSSFTASLEGTFVLHDINTALCFEFADEEVLEFEVELLTTESSVTIRSFDLENTT